MQMWEYMAAVLEKGSLWVRGGAVGRAQLAHEQTRDSLPLFIYLFHLFIYLSLRFGVLFPGTWGEVTPD